MSLMETEGGSHVAPDVLARYARDAACDVPGVTGLTGRHGGVKFEDGAVELTLAVEWGTSIPALGEAVQRRVADYLAQMTRARPSRVDVVVAEIGAPRDAGSS